MQNNILFKQIYADIKKAHYILIVIPNDASYDLICSSLALSIYCIENKIKHKVYSEMKNLPNRLDFLFRYEKITYSLPKYYDLIIYINEQKNIKTILPLIDKVKTVSFISKLESISWTSSQLLYDFFKFNGLRISRDVAECLYVGIYDYSGGFTKNINGMNIFTILSGLFKCGIDVSKITNNLLQKEPLSKFKCTAKIMNTLELHAEGKLASIYLEDNWMIETGAHIDECDDILDKVLNIGIVDIVVYFKMYNDNTVIISFKTKRKNIDISLIMKKFTNERKKPSTFNIQSTNLVETKHKVINAILDYISN